MKLCGWYSYTYFTGEEVVAKHVQKCSQSYKQLNESQYLDMS